MSTVIESIPAEFRAVVKNLLAERDPQLLSALRSQEKPTLDQQEAMIDVLADAFAEHLGPGHEPTEQGAFIDNALGAFLARWPAEDLVED